MTTLTHRRHTSERLNELIASARAAGPA